MAEGPVDPSVPGAANQALVQGSTPCIQCGYDLQGQTTDGACPECGAPVHLSLQGDTLSVSDPTWVGRLASGVLLMLIYFLVSLLVNIVRYGLPRVLSLVLPLGVSILNIVAVWLLTEPEPRMWRAEENLTLRKALRALTVVNFCGELLAIGAQMGESMPLRILAMVVQIVGLATYWLYYLHLSRLASRLPDGELSRGFVVVMWGYTIAAGAILVGAMAAMAAGRAGLIFACIGLLAIAIFAIWGIVLHVRLYAGLDRAAANARLLRALARPTRTG